jgi:hypothetical protein
MDGEPPPCSGSKGFKAIEAAIRNIQEAASDSELSVLALHVIGLVISRMRSNIAAETALRAFIQPGGAS